MSDPGDDGLLADWLAHYAALILIIIIATTSAATLWASIALPGSEMWTIVVDTEQRVPARQLGVVGEALFRAEDTYTEAMTELGMAGTSDALYDIVQLRSVPESRLLIVAARAEDDYRASIATDTMARALLHAFERSGYPGLRILGSPQPAPIASGLSLPVVALVASVLGILLGLGTAIALYRVRQPILTLERAVRVSRPDRVAAVAGRGRSLGALRRRPPTLSAGSARRAVHGLDAEGAMLAVPGATQTERARLARALGLPIDAHEDRLILACDPQTRERDLHAAIARRTSSVELLWIG